ncbi:MAG: cation transporter, partial [Candidatus Omnitrophota bacterium]
MRRKEQTILIATGAEAVLVALRFTLAYLSGSLGLRANAWHSLADLFVAFVVYLGLVLARQESKRFSGIIAKIEHIVALFVAGFIF